MHLHARPPTASSGVVGMLTSPAWMACLMSIKAVLQNEQRVQKRALASRDSVDIVDLVICLVSVLGSLVIIVPYCRTRRSRKLRHSLILGLATSDLVSRYVWLCVHAYRQGDCH